MKRIISKHIIFQRFVVFLLLLCVSLVMAGGVQAQVTANDVTAGCDVGFYQQLQASAELKATQEMEAAQTIIQKPDSVLEYNCFETRLAEAAASSLFQKDLAKDLDLLAGQPIQKYLEKNFDHPLDGGRAVAPSSPCGTMGVVWHTAQCHDFDIALFRDFAEMSDEDLRTFPMECPNKDARSEMIDAMVGVSHRAAKTGGADGTAEKVASYQDQLAKCGKPIPTGLKTKVKGINEERPEMICTAPGCYYDGGNCVPN